MNQSLRFLHSFLVERGASEDSFPLYANTFLYVFLQKESGQSRVRLEFLLEKLDCMPFGFIHDLPPPPKFALEVRAQRRSGARPPGHRSADNPSRGCVTTEVERLEALESKQRSK